jgi:hypothetical protein
MRALKSRNGRNDGKKKTNLGLPLEIIASLGDPEPDSFWEKGAPVGRLVGLRIRNGISRTHDFEVVNNSGLRCESTL